MDPAAATTTAAAAAAAPPPASAARAAAPSAAAPNKRYDRQVRVWGPEGQARLERARVALLGAGPAGTETLKNLVLAGIAAFTVVDGAAVCARDLGNNWLCARERLGEPRARCVAALLGELNEEARGSYVEDEPEALLRREPEFVTGPRAASPPDRAAAAAAANAQAAPRPCDPDRAPAYPSPPFDLVVASGLREPALLRLDALCRAARVSLLAVRAYGLSGTVRLSIAELPVWDSRPDSIVDDLRAAEPWPELLAHARATAGAEALAALDEREHRHVPFAAVLVAAAAAWRDARGGAAPATPDERAAFRAGLAALRRRAPEDQGGAPLEEENFDELARAAFHAWTPARVPSEAAAVLEDPLSADPPRDAPAFWLLAASLRAFVRAEGGGTRPPLEGSLPDMASTTAAYVALQRVYREKAAADAAAVGAHLRALLRRLGRDEAEIPAEEVRRACRHARHVRVVRWRTLAEEWYGSGPAGAAAAAAALAIGDDGGGGGGGGGDGGGGADAGGDGGISSGDPSAYHHHMADRAGSGSIGAGPAGAAAGGGGGGAGGGGGGGASSTSEGEALAAALADEGPTSRSASLYVLLRAADAFYAAHGRFPGAPPAPSSPASSPPDPGAAAAAATAAAAGPAGSPHEEDVPVLRALALGLLADLVAGGGCATAAHPPPLNDDCCAEVVRWGASELHCVAAAVGGVAAQEATKALTRAFVPAGSTVVYDAVACTMWGYGGA